ncbi:Mitochondrial fission protein [Tilletia horrida]|uniref:Mitochondrial fission protein n=1 Tax=Tilletia horrida TaxID=155126 RepID=A0AAN6GH25_9BASI|nr:Mitochondrial fission protein [Tilletia horrida]KAK0537195.1 Mitochondrial fission protein [Tilletia horrida]KAK0558535.1 Mitochondrial fission protein [Tilletia horrida]
MASSSSRSGGAGAGASSHNFGHGRRPSSSSRDPVTAVSGAFTEALAHTRAYLHPFAAAAVSTTSQAGTVAVAAVNTFTASASPQVDPGAQAEHARILADVAPHLLRPRILNAAIASGAAERAGLGAGAGSRTFTSRALLAAPTQLSLTHPARSLAKISAAIRHGPITSNQLRVLESADQILTALSTSQPSSGASASESPQNALTGLGPAGLIEDPALSLGLVDDDGPGGIASQVSLLDGFNATLPSALQGRTRRRKARASHRPPMGLKAMGDSARGLLTDAGVGGSDPAAAAEAAAASTFETKEARKARKAARGASLGKDAAAPLTAAELEAQVEEIRQDKERLNVRRMLLTAEITEVDTKIAALEAVRNDLHRGLVGMREEELELDEELTGVSELLEIQRLRSAMPGGEKVTVPGAAAPATSMNTGSTRRRRGPLFLPSEHDDLPSQVAFMTLQPSTLSRSSLHSASSSAGPITALDFSEPYGTLVSASSATDGAVRVWDLSTGEEVGRLRGHGGSASARANADNFDSAVSQSVVKCLQVEDALCVTGGVDASVRVWDLRRVEEHEVRLRLWAEQGHSEADRLGGAVRQGGQMGAATEGSIVVEGEDGVLVEAPDPKDEFDPCVSRLEGHSKEVTALYFDDNCLVTGASDKTLRQWDLNTGQCVLTMDILWAISNPSSAQALSGVAPGSDPGAQMGGSSILSPAASPRFGRSSLGGNAGAGLDDLTMSMSTLSAAGTGGAGANWTGTFSYPTPAYADGSWEMYTDFVGPGALQFWGYALASGSGDGAVRMWDMRTGQAHRTLLGHTAPVTCLQFDETHVISGSLDKSIRIWDLRMGAISDMIKYDFPVTALQFDTRKIVVAAGENALRIFNRTTLQQTPLLTNGHLAPAERLRYMDRYAVSGGKDSVIKVWAL